MAKPGPKKRFDDHIGFPIESELLDTLDRVAESRNLTRAQVCRRLLRENLEGFLDTEENQLSLTEDLEENGI